MLEEASHAFDNIARDIEGVEGDDDNLDDDDGKGSVNAGDAMSEEECEDVEVSGCPVWLVLTKVHKFKLRYRCWHSCGFKL